MKKKIIILLSVLAISLFLLIFPSIYLYVNFDGHTSIDNTFIDNTLFYSSIFISMWMSGIVLFYLSVKNLITIFINNESK